MRGRRLLHALALVRGGCCLGPLGSCLCRLCRGRGSLFGLRLIYGKGCQERTAIKRRRTRGTGGGGQVGARRGRRQRATKRAGLTISKVGESLPSSEAMSDMLVLLEDTSWYEVGRQLLQGLSSDHERFPRAEFGAVSNFKLRRACFRFPRFILPSGPTPSVLVTLTSVLLCWEFSPSWGVSLVARCGLWNRWWGCCLAARPGLSKRVRV